MNRGRFRLVLDTNIVLRGLARRDSASGRILRTCDERAVYLLLSRPVVLEYLAVLSDEEIQRRNPDITPEAVALVLRRLRYVSEYFGEVGTRFRFDRDRRDEKFIELALTGRATHIVTADRDLLSLASDHSEAAKRFRQRMPGIQVVEPRRFIEALEATLS